MIVTKHTITDRARDISSAPDSPLELAVTIRADTPADLARGLHEASLRIASGEHWGSAADTRCWVRWTTRSAGGEAPNE